ncbi:MAG TPA: hypothetical protein VE288_02330 [Rubrobacteraceae bacterium]|nr:hypothetical protein [Rubrobacteraceae bacterium]
MTEVGDAVVVARRLTRRVSALKKAYPVEDTVAGASQPRVGCIGGSIRYLRLVIGVPR